MGVRRLGIIMNGVTGRMGMNQHLIRSIVAIRDAGRRGARQRRPRDARPDPGRPQRRQARGAGQGARHRALHAPTSTRRSPTRTTRCSSTPRRRRCAPALLAKAIDAGKHIYCEKPIATNLEEALAHRAQAKAAGIKHGVVQDKLFLPGLRKLKMLIDCGLLRPHARRCAASSATGCSRATCSRRSARPGTTAPRTAAASSSTCSATGATCSTTCSAT